MPLAWHSDLQFYPTSLLPNQAFIIGSVLSKSQEAIHVIKASEISRAPIAHYGDVIMCAIASQITSLTIVYSTVSSDADQRKHQSSASLTFVRGIHRGPVNSPYKLPVTRKMFPFGTVGQYDAITWKRFSDYRPFASGIRRSSVDFPHKGPVLQNSAIFFVVSLNGLLNKQSRF